MRALNDIDYGDCDGMTYVRCGLFDICCAARVVIAAAYPVTTSTCAVVHNAAQDDIASEMPNEYGARAADKLSYRYPRGEVICCSHAHLCGLLLIGF
jgi:hypothetical protein